MRDIDVQLVAHLTAAIAEAAEGQDTTNHVQRALRALGSPDSHDLKIALALYRGERLVAANVPTRESHDAAIAAYGPVEAIDLPHGWRLVVARPEQKFSFDAFHSFLHTPLRQWFSSNDFDITWRTVLKKAGPPMAIALLIGMVLMAIAVWLEYHHTRHLKEAERRLEVLEGRLDELLQERQALEDELDQERTRLEESKQLEEITESELAHKIEALRQKDAEIRTLRNQITEHNERMRELVRSSAEAARESAQQGELLKKVWPHLQWHPEALKEAQDWYRRRNPTERQKLTRLLLESTEPGQWQAMRHISGDIYHNAGKDSVKLYWQRLGEDARVILKICGGGDVHERIDAQLRTRSKRVKRAA